MEEFCTSYPCLQTHDGVLKKASSYPSDKGAHGKASRDKEDIFLQRERAKKARKLTRRLREYTSRVPSEGEKKCKG